MIKQGFIAAAFVKELEVITPSGKQEVSLAQLYPGKSFMGYLPVFATEEDASEEGGCIHRIWIEANKEAE